MSDALKFVFELVDKMSGPSRAIEKQLKSVDDAIRKTDSSMKRAAIDKMTPGLARQRAELGLQRDAMLFAKRGANEYADKMGRVHDVIGKVALGAVAVGGAILASKIAFAKSAIEVASFAEDNKVALKVVTGSQSEANGVLKDMIGLAAHLPITDQVAMGAATRFMLAGFKRDELQNMVTAMSDVQAMNPGRGVEAMNDFANLMTRVKTAGATVPHLLQAVTSELHVNPDEIRKSLVSMGYLLKTTEQMRHALSSGAVNKDDFIQATVGAISSMTGGKGVGNISKELSTTLTGLMSTIEGRKFALMIDLDTSPGYAGLRKFLSNVVDLTDPSSESGKAIAKNLSDSFGQMANMFSNVTASDMKDALTGILGVLNGISAVTGVIASTFGAVGKAVGWVASKVAGEGASASGSLGALSPDALRRAASGGGLGAMPQEQVLEAAKRAAVNAGISPDAFSSEIAGRLVAVRKSASGMTALATQQLWDLTASSSAGADIANGLVAGMTGGMPVVADAGSALGQAAIDAHKEVTQTHSPSRVFQELGAFTAEGYALGVRGGIGEAQAAVAMLGAAPRASIGSGGGGSGGSISAPITINIDARGATKDDAHAIATVVEDAIPSALVRVFDMLSTQYGNP